MSTGSWRAFKLVVVVAASALSVACQSGVRPPYSASQDDALPYPNITVDPGLQRFLVVDYPAIVEQPATVGRPLTIQVPLRSQADNEFDVQYNFEFFAADMTRVGETGWKRETLPSRRQKMLSGNAITPRATSWRLDVRLAR